MPNPQLNRDELNIQPLAARANKLQIDKMHIDLRTIPEPLPAAGQAILEETVERIRRARAAGRPVMLTFGAHTIKNGLAPVLIRLIEKGWVTHLATNGAGIIHDWEFAFQGCSSEDVRANVAVGQFGIWQETGFNINLALVAGAYEGRGYGESVGALIANDGIDIPTAAALAVRTDGAAADFREVIARFGLPAGLRSVPHPWKHYSVQAAAFRMGIPFTGHPMIVLPIRVL